MACKQLTLEERYHKGTTRNVFLNYLNNKVAHFRLELTYTIKCFVIYLIVYFYTCYTTIKQSKRIKRGDYDEAMV